jgi:hypothetical protein
MNDAAAEFFAVNVAFSAGSWNDCVEYLGFNASELETTPLPRRWSQKRLTKDVKRQVFTDIAAHPEFGPRSKRWLSEKSALTRRYLTESGLVAKVPCGLVDCGWSGKWTDIISDLVVLSGGAEPEVFFLGRRNENVPSRSRTFAFLFDHQSGLGLDRVPDSFHVIIEFFLTAGHGRTEGFKDEAGKVIPVLAAVDMQGFKLEEWRGFRTALMRFAVVYAEQYLSGSPQADLRRTLVELTEMLWESPTAGEAELLARHTIGLSPNRSAGLRLARSYRVSDLLRLVFRFKLPGYPPFWWHEGALALTQPGLRFVMGVLWQLRELARDLRRGIIEPGNIRSMLNAIRASAKKVFRQMVPPRDACFPRLTATDYQIVPAKISSVVDKRVVPTPRRQTQTT